MSAKTALKKAIKKAGGQSALARKLGISQQTVSLRELVDGLNALGIGPRDMITILQAIKAAGALQAEIEVM